MNCLYFEQQRYIEIITKGFELVWLQVTNVEGPCKLLREDAESYPLRWWRLGSPWPVWAGALEPKYCLSCSLWIFLITFYLYIISDLQKGQKNSIKYFHMLSPRFLKCGFVPSYPICSPIYSCLSFRPSTHPISHLSLCWTCQPFLHPSSEPSFSYKYRTKSLNWCHRLNIWPLPPICISRFESPRCKYQEVPKR